MNCDYFDRAECRSCTHLPTPYEVQLADRQHHVEALLATVPTARHMTWEAAAASSPSGFRSKAKMAIGGCAGAPTLGLLDDQWQGVDLSRCPILHPAITRALPTISEFIAQNRLEPYNVATRRGELKYVLITADTQDVDTQGADTQGAETQADTQTADPQADTQSADTQTADPQGMAAKGAGLLIRFVLRSRHHEALLRSRLPDLQAALPNARVVTINLHPTHAAIVEGDEEIILTGEETLPLMVGDVRLRVGPRSFTQTNTRVSAELYRTVARWARAGTLPTSAVGVESATPAALAAPIAPAAPAAPIAPAATMSASAEPATLWDLYCGVGGFALHAAKAGIPHVTGVEISDAAIASAQVAARELFGEAAADRTAFITADATQWAIEQDSRPDVVIVNPPRRGIGANLAEWINTSGVPTLIYSSCNPRTLATDLTRMSNSRVVEGRLFDMFPHTDHAEVAVLCQRAD